MKKILCVILVVLMCLTAAPLGGFADLDLGITASALNATGKCGKTATYTFDSATGKLTIEGTGKINTEAFYSNQDIKEVVIGDGITEIGADAFNNCTNLTTLDLGNTVTVIGDKAFYCCYNLIGVEIPDSVKTIGNIAFQSCNNLTSAIIGDAVTTIGDSAFQFCDKLASLDIGDSVTTIGNEAFCDCDNLTSVIIPDSVLTIGGSAFWDSDNLTSVVIGNGVKTIEGYAFSYCDNLTSVTVGNSVEKIDWGAFVNCTSLESINIPKTVTYIGGEAFRYCPSLTDVYYEGAEENWNAINIGENNTALENAEIHFGEEYVGCVHRWNEATCVVPKTCAICGKTLGVALSVHTWNAGEVTKAPTCVTKGVKTFSCTVAGCTEMKIEDIEIDPSAHNITGVSLTKKDDNKHGKQCANEGCTAWLNEAAHDYATVVAMTLATCVTHGAETRKCVCGDTKTEVLDRNDNHDWGVYMEKTPATCTTAGSEEATCKRPGCTDKDIREIAALGHDMDEVAAKEATCKEAGNNKYYACDSCKKFFKDEAGAIETTISAEIIAKGEHVFTKYAISKDATCTANAVEKATCDICREATYERAIPGTMVAHLYKNYKSNGDATCIADGTMTAVCELCKEAKDIKMDVGSHKTAPHKPDSTGRKCELCNAELVCTHTYSAEKLITKTPTCTTNGEKAIVCSKCKANKPGSEEEIPVTGHYWDISETKKKATCTEEGILVYKCIDCKETKEETISATGHDYWDIDSKQETCTEDGYWVWKCSVCKDTYTETIPATGHSYPSTWSVLITPDCQNTGFAVKVCFSCHDVIAQVVPKAGHADNDGDSHCDTCNYEIIVVEPTEPETPDEPADEPEVPDEPEAKPCDCNCHAGGLKAFFFKLTNFFAKIFSKDARICKCGSAH